MGKATEWRDRLFPDLMRRQILQLVIRGWKSCKDRVLANSLEPKINTLLAISLRKCKENLPFSIHTNVEVLDKSEGTVRGKIDICLLGCPDEDVYFAFECKRLRYPTRKGLRSNASEYVEKGMMRFVEGKYSSGLPFAGMIGYVMDGRSAKAIDTIHQSIRMYKIDLCVCRDDMLVPCELLRNCPVAKESLHSLSSVNLTIYHLFLVV